jgi:hypothetical protein
MSTPASTLNAGRTPPPRALPPSNQVFTAHQLVERHLHLLTPAKVSWALRHRHDNGLAPAIFESPGKQLLIDEPGFLAWFLGLSGRRKPRASRRRQRGPR